MTDAILKLFYMKKKNNRNGNCGNCICLIFCIFPDCNLDVCLHYRLQERAGSSELVLILGLEKLMCQLFSCCEVRGHSVPH